MLNPQSFLLLTIVSLAVLTGCSTRAADEGAGNSPDGPVIRFVSYNIAATREASLDDLAAVMRELDPDVVALQEVASNWAEDTGFEDQAAALGQRLGMEAFYAPIYSMPDQDGVPRQFGLAILTSLPVVKTANHEITRHSTQNEDAAPVLMPGFAEMVIEVQGSTVRVFNTHLDFRQDPAVRQMQVSEMIEIMGDLSEPTLLLGDLNAPPDADEIQPLLERFTDAWEGQQDPGYTGPTTSPRSRIDYILFSPHCEVLDVRLSDAMTSDHFPVLADLTCTR